VHGNASNACAIVHSLNVRLYTVSIEKTTVLYIILIIDNMRCSNQLYYDVICHAELGSWMLRVCCFASIREVAREFGCPAQFLNKWHFGPWRKMVDLRPPLGPVRPRLVLERPLLSFLTCAPVNSTPSVSGEKEWNRITWVKSIVSSRVSRRVTRPPTALRMFFPTQPVAVTLQAPSPL